MVSPSGLQKPDWLKIRPPGGDNYTRLKKLIHGLKLHTVCEEAACPNVAECWSEKTATLLLMGDTCTRGCKFCHIKTGNPQGYLDPMEPENVGNAIASLELSYVVLTSVDRDDLPDGGAGHFAKTVQSIKKKSPRTLVEVLVPDFTGNETSIVRVLKSGPDVFAHNLETVERLTQKVRDVRCGYQQSLDVLRIAKQMNPQMYTKSSLMLGLGERGSEIEKAMEDLRSVGVDILTLGQYLRPSSWHLPVETYVHPETFKEWERVGLSKGFLSVPSGPLVRSSYRAGEKFLESRIREERRHSGGS